MSESEWAALRDADTVDLPDGVDGRQLVAVALEVRAEGFAAAADRLTTLRAALRTASVTVKDVRQVNSLGGGLSSNGWRTS